MARTRVHASPSHSETPGLANLEAAAMGCSLAVGDCAPVREYFGSGVEYMRSDDVDSISTGVARALERNDNAGLRSRVLTNYTWDIAAGAILDVYQSILLGATQELEAV